MAVPPPGINPGNHWFERLGGLQDWSKFLEEKINLLSLSWIDLQFIGHYTDWAISTTIKTKVQTCVYYKINLPLNIK